VVDALQCSVQPLRPLLHSPVEFLGHNLKFELHMLAAAGLPWPTNLVDTMLLAQLLGATAQKGVKVSYSLQDVAQRTLGVRLDKTLQTSDWRGAVSPEQLQYAARDAAILLPLVDALVPEAQAVGLTQVLALEHACLPALVWMEQAGVPVDSDRWMDLAHRQTHTAAKYEAELQAMHAHARPHGGALFPASVNWQSHEQVLAVLADRGHQVPNTAADTLAPLVAQDPLVAHLLAYREAGLRARTFGEKFLRKHLHPLSRRVHADDFQLGSRAGRMSCGHPNMQNIPRSSAYRACFRATDGQCLIKADYSQIELRIAALMASEATMLAAFQAGEDIHRLTAARLLGVALTEVTKPHRQMAKAVNFGLIYGMGAPRLQQHAQQQYRVSLTLDEAKAHRHAFFDLYPRLRRWHRATGAVLDREGSIETRTLTNRRRLAVAKYTEALNTPVQGTGADGMKAALARLWTHRHEAPDARLIASIHDEVVAECPIEQADETAAWMQRHMQAAMSAIVQDGVPIEVETTIGQDWAGTPLHQTSTPA
jgi:DNA polymerase I